MNNSLKDEILGMCSQLDIPMMGIAPVERWATPLFEPWIPEQFHPHNIFPEAVSVIVIGLPVTLPVIETTPSIYYYELYRTINTMLDQYGYRISNFLNRKGHPSVFVPRDGYGDISVLINEPTAFFSHRHAAFLAGLGSFGVNNTLLTKEYGPRVRFTSILTSAKLPTDSVMEDDLCTRCMGCVRCCPVGAIDKKDYPEGIIRKDLCSKYSEKLRNRFISPCGVCIKVCPIGEDRKHYGREDTSIYTDCDKYRVHHEAWEHVRRYGGK
ncbi:MAG: epoxyqueuosine reductase [Methanosarcinaceae archaeon]|nr:epoxyqueuosine reductase [Methanosarcinaceae archaeon]